MQNERHSNGLTPSFAKASAFAQPAAAIAGCQTLNLCGNILVRGGYAVWYEENRANALVLNNDFSGATCRAIGYLFGDSALPNAQIYGNILGEGVSFHAQIMPYNGFGWFLKQNQYRNGSAIVPAFLDPAASSARLSN